MKKQLLFIIFFTGLFVAACTSKDQNDKVFGFWAEQMAKVTGRTPATATNNAPQPIDLAHMDPAMLAELTKNMSPEQKKAFEEMLKQMQDADAMPQGINPSSTTALAAAPDPNKVQAILFYHPTAPFYQQLKREKWDVQFHEKYGEKISLVSYDVSEDVNRDVLRETMRKHRMKTLTVPTLIIGNTVVGRYPFRDADKIAQKEISGKTSSGQKGNASRQSTKPFMQITMEADDAPVLEVSSKKFGKSIKAALEKTRQDNQNTLHDIEQIFDRNTYAEAFAIVSRNEDTLIRTANSSPDLKTYLATQKRILKEQEVQLNLLMQKNAGKVGRIR